MFFMKRRQYPKHRSPLCCGVFASAFMRIMIGASAEAWHIAVCVLTPNQCASEQAPKNYFLECFVQAFFVVDKLDKMFYFPLNSSSYIRHFARNRANDEHI
jgi:hypothetical protein